MPPDAAARRYSRPSASVAMTCSPASAARPSRPGRGGPTPFSETSAACDRQVGVTARLAHRRTHSARAFWTVTSDAPASGARTLSDAVSVASRPAGPPLAAVVAGAMPRRRATMARWHRAANMRLLRGVWYEASQRSIRCHVGSRRAAHSPRPDTLQTAAGCPHAPAEWQPARRLKPNMGAHEHLLLATSPATARSSTATQWRSSCWAGCTTA